MKILLAKNMGFCHGVKKAIQIAEKSQKNTYILGSIIHNRQVINKLKKKGLILIKNASKITNSKIILGAHGHSSTLEKKLIAQNNCLADTTCINVKQIHKIVEKYSSLGYNILIFGDSDHAEVKAIRSYCRKSFVISKSVDIKSLHKILHEKNCLISQTTQNVREFELLSKNLRKKLPNLIIINTICDATSKRQESAISIAKKSDIILVIGDKSSGNVNRLKDVCSKYTTTYLIPNAKSINKSWLKNIRFLGITAGASTPDWLITEVLEKIKCFEK
jgi:4-hydroxy-3-methylbut-2-en-1-yl diphosphate reductase